MVKKRFLTVAIVAAFSLIPTLRQSVSASEPLKQISVDPYTNPDSQHKTQVEPDTFAFGNTVVSAFQSGRYFDGGASNIGFSTSTNRGNTWTHGFLPATTVNATPPGTYTRTSDPSVAYDAKHNVWMVSFLAFSDPNTSPDDVLVSRSTDGGLTWGTPVIVNKSGHFNDKNWTVCDDTPTSRYYGRCYTQFDDSGNNNLVQMSTSLDGGSTWSAPKTTPDNACVIGGQPLVQPDGTVIVPIADCNIATIESFRSTDGGATWSTITVVAKIVEASDGVLRSGALPSAEIDAAGRVYVVWEDCRFESGCSANDIVMSTSNDGIEWTLPKRIPIDPIGSGVDHFIPGLAVDRTTFSSHAHLGLAYYYYPNATCTPTTCKLDVGFLSSINGGASWSVKQRLAGPMSLSWLPNTTLGRMVGDYISTSIVPGDDDATPVFAVAFPPTGGTSCDVSPVMCHENTYTTPDEVAKILGGSVTAGANEVPVVTSGTRNTIRPQTAR